MKIVIAPQHFKGSLTALEAAQAMERGIRRALPDLESILLPMADGGEGTVAALVAATEGRIMTCQVTGPLGAAVVARWGLLGDGTTAVIEMASASGITLVPAERLDPASATTYGTGQLIRAALDAGCGKLIIGIGGSATNDGGAGMAQALGARLLDRQGQPLPPGGAALKELARIDCSRLDSRLKDCQVVVACDVTNPLCGSQGASAVYGPQKGATPEMVQQLDAALANYARVIHRDLGAAVTDLPGAGAAGGLGAGLVAFLGARLQPGVEMVCHACHIDDVLRDVDLVFTGEGKIDGQTAFGKTVVGIARRARAWGVPTIVIAGSIGDGYEAVYAQGVSAVVSIAPGPLSLAETMANAERLVTDAAERAMRLLMTGRGLADERRAG